MKLRLGSKTIDLRRVSPIKQIDLLTCEIKFITGEAIRVRCYAKEPAHGLISFPETPEDLIRLVRKYICT